MRYCIMQYSRKQKTSFPKTACIMPADLINLAMQQDLSKQLPKRIADIRKRQGLTQVQVAEKLGTSQGNYALYETGARGVSLKLLPKVAEALDVDLEELLGLEPSKPKKRGPSSQLEKRFQQVAKLPMSKQKKILEVVDALIAQAS